jgi:Zn2+/Cd2+-exporting ATPase
MTTPHTSRIFVEKMDCPTEEKLIRKELDGMADVLELRFNLLERELTVVHRLPSDQPVLAKLDALGLGPRVIEPGPVAAAPTSTPSWVRRHALLAVSGACAGAAEIVAYIAEDETSILVAVLAGASVLLGGIPTLRKGLVALRTFTLNINLLMSFAIAGAVALREWPEAAMVTFLFALAEAIEGASLERARDAVRGLLEKTPDVASTLRKGRWTEVSVAEIVVGDRVRVRAGERVAVDGTIATGRSSLNQAAITGESIPVDKGPGDAVFAGTLNENGALEVTVTKAADDTTIARIVRSIREAQSERAPTQRFVDRFARYYTPAVVLVAALVAVVPPFFFGHAFVPWVYRALVLLVIACPCALVLSTPVTVVSGLAAAARNGTLIKGGAYLEEGRRLRAVALDKTGTVTAGKPRVTDVVAFGDHDGAAVLTLAAQIEAGSEHPIARAVLEHHRATQTGETELREAEDVETIVGRGLRARIDGREYVLGSHAFVESRGVCSAEVEAALARLEKDGKTTMVLADDQRGLGVLAVADEPRPTSIEAVADLRRLGVSIVMLTGDNAATAAAVARHVGIEDVRAELMPDDKVAAIAELLGSHGHVAMVGDGINDAPALARASIGFAMGAAGSDTAIETADVAFMDDDLRRLPAFIELSAATHKRLVENITVALGIKLAFLGLSFAGIATLWMAVFADMGASLLVVANGLRLLRFRRNETGEDAVNRRSAA